MPTDFHAGDVFARYSQHGSNDSRVTDFNQGHEMIKHFKITLIGNHELKKGLLEDDTFPGWFRDYLQQCVDCLVARNITANVNLPDLTPSQEFQKSACLDDPPNRNMFSDGLEMDSSSADCNILDPLTNLRNAIVVLRLLLTGRELQTERPSSSKASSPSSSLGGCVPVLLAFIAHINKVIFPNLESTLLSPTWSILWKSLSPVLLDTIRAILLFTESNKSAFSRSCSPLLWSFFSGLFAQFTVAEDAPSLLAPVILESYNLLPFLLALDTADRSSPNYKSSGYFLSQNIRHLDYQLDRMFPLFLQNMPKHFEGVSQISPTILLDMNLLQNSLDFHLLSAMTLATAQIVNFLKDADYLNSSSTDVAFFTSPKFHQCLLMFFYADNHYVLNVAALNLFHFRLASMENGAITSESTTFLSFEKMFPRIIELLNHQVDIVVQTPGYLKLPVNVLSDICLKYPKFSNQLNNTKVDKNIMKQLSKLLETSSVFSFLQEAKGLYTRTKNAIDFSPLRRNILGSRNALFSPQKSELSLIASHFLLLSVFASSNEDFRRRVASYIPEDETKIDPNFLCLAIFEIVENYDFLSTQLLLNYKMYRKLQDVKSTTSSERLLAWLSENVTVLLTLLEHPLNKNAFYLMRSLSRSVSTLRTFFVDSNSIKSSFEIGCDETSISQSADPAIKTKSVIENIKARYDRESNSGEKGNLISCFLKIIGRLSNVDKKILFFSSTKVGGSTEIQRVTRKDMAERNVVLLAILANFVLDFSSFRYEIVSHDRILKDLASLFKSSLQSQKQCDKHCKSNKELQEANFEQLRVQISILQVVKNYLYNEDEENRKVVWDHIPLSLIFELSLYGISGTVETDWELHKLRIEQKILSFEILRNLTAASFYFSESIDKLYLEFSENYQVDESFPKTWNKYLLDNLMCFNLFVELNTSKENLHRLFMEDDEFVLRALKETEFVKLIVAINYLEDHRFTNIRKFRASDFPHRALLSVWKRLLGLSLSKELESRICGSDLSAAVKLTNQINEVKISITWILINLTWEEENFEDRLPTGTTFPLMDIILTRHNMTSFRDETLTDSRIIEANEDDKEKEEEEEEVGDEERITINGSLENRFRTLPSNTLYSLRTRAQLLYKAGFCQVLERLVGELSSPKPTVTEDKVFSMQRFDSLSSNDLFEKCKSAQYKILSLIMRQKENAPVDSPRAERIEPRSSRRVSTTGDDRIGSNDRPDLNRGGEGFGYESEEESYARAQVIERSNQEQEDDLPDEEFDEYWVR